MNFKPYTEYKTSGIDWLGQVPSHWEVSKTSWSFESIGSGTTPSSGADEYYTNGTINWLQTGDLNDGIITSTSKKITALAAEDKGLKLYPKGALVIAMYGATIAKTGLLDIDTTVNQACCILTPSEKVNNKFAFYYFNASKTALISLASGGGQPNISQAIIASFEILVPTLEEQEAIAGYLDEVTGKIDTLISEKKVQVEELRAYRSSLITETVTRGLNPDVPLRDSGIDWLGKIPQHWEMSKLKYITDKIGSGVTPKGGAEVYSETGILFIRSQNVYPDGLHLDEPTYITEAIDEGMSNTRVYKGDVLLNITGASIGRCCVYTLEGQANVNQHVCIIRPLTNKISDKYLQFVLNSKNGQTQIKLSQTGGNREGLNFEQLKNFFIPVPPISEQQEIADFLDEKTGKIDQLIEELTMQLYELAEYKQAVITEAVTGKVDVRDYKPKL